MKPKTLSALQVPQGRHFINRMLQLTETGHALATEVPQGQHFINRMLQLTETGHRHLKTDAQ